MVGDRTEWMGICGGTVVMSSHQIVLPKIELYEITKSGFPPWALNVIHIRL